MAEAPGTSNETITETIQVETPPPPQQEGRSLTIKLRKRKTDKKVEWSSDTVDNEHLGRRSSKCCCVYEKPKQFGESSSESEEMTATKAVEVHTAFWDMGKTGMDTVEGAGRVRCLPAPGITHPLMIRSGAEGGVEPGGSSVYDNDTLYYYTRSHLVQSLQYWEEKEEIDKD